MHKIPWAELLWAYRLRGVTDSWNPSVSACSGSDELHVAWRTRFAVGKLADTGRADEGCGEQDHEPEDDDMARSGDLVLLGR